MLNIKTITPEEEYAIVKRSIEDPKYFRVIYNLHFNAVFRFIHNRINDVNITSDIVSEVFYKALTKLSSYKFKGLSIKPWLLRIAYNEMMTHFRKEGKQRFVSIESESVKEIVQEYEEIAILDNEELIAGLNQMSEEDLSLIEMRYFEQKRFHEIGEILGISTNYARVSTFRAVKRLKQVLVKAG